MSLSICCRQYWEFKAPSKGSKHRTVISKFRAAGSDDGGKCLALSFNLKCKQFKIQVVLSKFRDSPNLLATAEGLHAALGDLARAVDREISYGVNATSLIELSAHGIPKCISDARRFVVPRFLDTFKALAPETNATRPITLQDISIMEPFVVKVGAMDDDLVILEIQDPSAAQGLPKYDKKINGSLPDGCPVVDPSLICVWDNSPSMINAEPLERLVEYRGSYFEFKSVYLPFGEHYPPTLREVDAYIKMARAFSVPYKIQVQTLEAIVQNQAGRVLGMLLEPLQDPVTLPQALYPSHGGGAAIPSRAMRLSWIIQIRNALTELHGIDVVWGDARPENVKIGLDDKAYICNFISTAEHVHGYPPPTQEDDLAGLRVIIKYIMQDLLEDGYEPDYYEQDYNGTEYGVPDYGVPDDDEHGDDEQNNDEQDDHEQDNHEQDNHEQECTAVKRRRTSSVEGESLQGQNVEPVIEEQLRRSKRRKRNAT